MKKRDIFSGWGVPALIAGLTLADFVVMLFFPDNLPAWVQTGWLLLALGAGVLCFRKKPQGIIEWLIIGYFLWTVVTRLVLRDFTYKAWIELLRSASIMLVFLLVHRMPEGQSRRVWQFFGGLLCAYLTVWAVQGLRVVLTGGNEFGFWRQVLSIAEEEEVRFVQVGSLHRNSTAAWFMIGLWLLCIQWNLCEKKVWRVPIALDALLMYCMMALQRCRSVCVGIGIGVGLLAAMGVWKACRDRKRVVQVPLALLAAAVCALTVYKSFDWTNDGLTRFSARVQTKTASQAEAGEMRVAPMETPTAGIVSAAEMISAPESVPEVSDTAAIVSQAALIKITGLETVPPLSEGNQVEDNRNFFRDLLTLTGRTGIWLSELYVVKSNPMFLIFGQKRTEIVQNLAIYAGMTRASHTHNGYIQILALYGLPGLILFGLFSVLLVKKVVLLFFSDASVSRKLFLIPVIALLLYSVLEPLFCSSCMPSVCFALFAAGLDAAQNEKLH